MLPPRTSPTAKTPGTLVSSKYGGRARGQRAALRSSGDRSAPVLMNPLAFSPTNSRTPCAPTTEGVAARIMPKSTRLFFAKCIIPFTFSLHSFAALLFPFRLAAPSCFADLLDDVKHHRNEEDSDPGCREHAADDGRTHHFPGDGAGSAGKGQGN